MCGQTWCTSYQPQFAIMLLANDVHSNTRHRSEALFVCIAHLYMMITVAVGG